jgi:hypothetical protein
MTIVLILLAIPGVLAVLVRLFIALARASKFTAERYVARQIKQQRAERGDLSGLSEAEKIRTTAARQQTRFVAESLGWVMLLALPLMFPFALFLYPLYSVFWLLPNPYLHKVTRR